MNKLYTTTQIQQLLIFYHICFSIPPSFSPHFFLLNHLKISYKYYDVSLLNISACMSKILFLKLNVHMNHWESLFKFKFWFRWSEEVAETAFLMTSPVMPMLCVHLPHFEQQGTKVYSPIYPQYLSSPKINNYQIQSPYSDFFANVFYSLSSF